MAILLKTASVRVKSYKLESKTRAKVFGKVDTTETYHAARGEQGPGHPGAKVSGTRTKSGQLPCGVAGHQG